MKKNNLWKAVSALLSVTLLSATLLGGTMAKYTVSASGSDTARVAKFGVNITAASNSAFETSYQTDDSLVKSEIAASVVSSNSDNMIAPGTKGEFTSVKLSGTPEVAVRVDYELSNMQLQGWAVNNAYYCPLEISVNDKVIKGLDYQNADAFMKAVKKAVSDCSAKYAANTNLSGVTSAPVVKWAWQFDANDDQKDTALGNAGTANVSMTMKTTVTQVD